MAEFPWATMVVPKEIVEHFKKEKLNLTGSDIDAVRVLYKRCMADDVLREVMTSIRGDKPEWLIKHFFRDKGDRWVKETRDREMKEIVKRLENIDPAIFPDDLFKNE